MEQEWTLSSWKFSGQEFFILSKQVDDKTKHSILIEYDQRTAQWQVRDACDRGLPRQSLVTAFATYIDLSRHANASAIGHCGWMLEIGLPSLEECLAEIIREIITLNTTENISWN
jgi:hypothetical protein